jgi:hypothetical protein
MKKRDDMRGLCLFLIGALCFTGVVFAKKSKEDYHRSFWYPNYHGERLAYCNKDETQCGKIIADAYCKTLEYAEVDDYRIAHHVGRTHYFDNQGECTGWKCDGFLFINCRGHFNEMPHPTYQYRMRKFVYPRYENDRVDWCYKEKIACGKRAAYSFCRRMGYTAAENFKRDDEVLSAKTLGDHVLCYGKTCKGFQHITCRR